MDHRSDLYSLGVTYLPHARRPAAVPGRDGAGPGDEARRRHPGRPLGPPARPPARPGPAGHEADGQVAGRPLPVGRRDAPRPGQDPRGAPGLGRRRRGPAGAPSTPGRRPSRSRRSTSPRARADAGRRRPAGPRSAWPGRRVARGRLGGRPGRLGGLAGLARPAGRPPRGRRRRPGPPPPPLWIAPDWAQVERKADARGPVSLRPDPGRRGRPRGRLGRRLGLLPAATPSGPRGPTPSSPASCSARRDRDRLKAFADVLRDDRTTAGTRS